MKILLYLSFVLLSTSFSIKNVYGQATDNDPAKLLDAGYEKNEYMVPMRDGVKLYTAVYTPVDKGQEYPFLLKRTPYSCNPYGEQS